MVDDAPRLVIASIDGRIDKLEKALDKAGRLTEKRTGEMANAASRSSRRIEADMGRAASSIDRAFGSFKGFAAGLAGALTIKGAQNLLDTQKRIQNALKVTGLEGDELRKVYDKLYVSAQANAAPLETLVGLYGNVARQQGPLKATTGELLNFVDSIAVALRVGGSNAQSASGALTQLGQALGGGTVRAEEFNSILEGAPTILQAAAAGIKEAGGSVSELRKLMLDSKLSSEALFRGFLAGSQILRSQVATSTLTVEQAWTKVYNAAVNAAGAIDDATGISKDAAGALADLAHWIDVAGGSFSGLAGPIQAATGYMHDFYLSATLAGQALGDFLGTSGDRVDRTFQDARNGGLPNDDLAKALNAKAKKAGSELIGNRVNEVFDTLDKSTNKALDKALSAAAAKKQEAMLPKTPMAPGAISLADFMPPVGAGAGGKGGRGGGSRGGSAAAARGERDAVQELIQSLEEERSLIGATEAERAVATNLRRAGAEATEAEKAKIRELTAAIEAEQAAQQKATEARQEFSGLATDGLKGIVSDLMAGRSAAEAFAGAVQNLAARLADLAIDKFGSSIAGSIITATLGAPGAGGIFATGGYTGDGGKYEPAGVVHRGEFVFSKTAVERAGVQNLARLHTTLKGYAEGGAVGAVEGAVGAALTRSREAGGEVAPQNITINAPITVQGSSGTPEQNTDLANKTAKAMEQTVRTVIADEMRKQSRPGNYLNSRAR